MDLRSVVSTIRLLHPSTLILLGANLLPLAGILFWDWDAFVLLMLYWLETAIIGFWMLVRVATADPASIGQSKDGSRTVWTRFGLTIFFILHAGMFMAGHLLFLWLIFSGDWGSRIHSLGDFLRKLVIGTGLWLPLLVLFLARGAAFFYDRILIGLMARRSGKPPPPPETTGSIVGGFYARIIVMHVAIILGGFLSFLGSVGPLIILVALKTVIDLFLHATFEFADTGKPASAPA